MKAIQDEGLNVPNDISVVGAGNVHYSDVLAIPLTTVDQNTAETGRCAAELLLERIEAKGAARVRKVSIPLRLIERDSTRRIL
jgi:LacI family transcriptional regulator